jgi:hypothetical protein
MPDSCPIREFKVVVNKYGHIEAFEKPATVNITRQELKADDVRRRTIALLVKMLRANRLRERDELGVLGENLYSVLFDNEIGNRLNSALDEAVDFLRVELEFEDQPQLASWPWEYLCRPIKGQNSGYFLANQVKLILARRVTVTDFKLRDLLVKDAPLRVLFVAASPREEPSGEKEVNEPMPQVQYESVLNELETLENAKEPRSTDNAGHVGNLVDLIKLEPWTKPGDKPSDDNPPLATFANFSHLVQTTNPHVIHFIGHGRCSEARGEIAFMKVDGRAHWIDQTDLTDAVFAAPALKLVFLQACESALADPYQAVSGCARELAGRNIPAVVGMQYAVENKVANTFAREFYKALADYQPVDVAVQKARIAVKTDTSDSEKYHAFGLPVLYLKRLDGESGALLASLQRERPQELDGRRREQRQASEAETFTASLVESGLDELRSARQGVKPPSEPLFPCPWCEALCAASLLYCTKCRYPLVCPKCKRKVEANTEMCLYADCSEPLRPVQLVNVFAARAAVR